MELEGQYTKNELVILAKENNIDVNPAWKKEKIRKAIENHEWRDEPKKQAKRPKNRSGVLTIPLKRIDDYVTLPEFKSTGAACMDLYAAETTHIFPLKFTKVRTGVAIELPPGYVAEILPRSGLVQQGIVAQHGVIDSDYRGEIFVTMTLFHRAALRRHPVQKEDRIAQLIVRPALEWQWEVVDQLSKTDRGSNGFGSTGR